MLLPGLLACFGHYTGSGRKQPEKIKTAASFFGSGRETEPGSGRAEKGQGG